jgi:hypothetical protein
VLKKMFAAEANAKQMTGKGEDGSGGRGHKKPSGKSAIRFPETSRDRAAAIMNVSPRQVQQAELVVERAAAGGALKR